MKAKYLVFPFALLLLSGCGTADRMNQLVNESTYSINANREAVARSNAVIAENARLIEESTKTIEENGRHLQSLDKQ